MAMDFSVCAQDGFVMSVLDADDRGSWKDSVKILNPEIRLDERYTDQQFAQAASVPRLPRINCIQDRKVTLTLSIFMTLHP